MRLHDVEQRTDAWRLLRAGKVTGTRAKALLTKIGKGEAAARRDLRMLVVSERLTGLPQESDYVNADMQWGVDREPDAIAAYEAVTGHLVTLVGFCEHDTLCGAGTSPDGLVGDHGIVSIKCPKTATHVRYLREGVEPSEHAAQNTHELFVTGRPWLDFVSFDPRLPENLRLFVRRVTRTAAELAAYEAELTAFLAECDTEVSALLTMSNIRGTLAAAVAVAS